jgi:hypothetical protein
MTFQWSGVLRWHKEAPGKYYAFDFQGAKNCFDQTGCWYAENQGYSANPWKLSYQNFERDGRPSSGVCEFINNHATLADAKLNADTHVKIRQRKAAGII